jgi:raffinose/stachyose/melibiose transport system permease protein
MAQLTQTTALPPPGETQPPGTQRRRSKTLHAAGRAGAWPYLLILPGLCFYAMFVLFPIIETVRLSFLKWDGLNAPTFVGLTNYVNVLNDQTTWQAATVSLTFIIFSCLMPVGVALLLSGIIARMRVRGLSFLRFAFFLPYTIALAVVAIAWRWLYATDGSINMIVGAIFGKENTRAYLGDMELALPALGIVAFWTMFGFVVVMLLSGTQHIPKELYDAARSDGAGPIREFFAVTLPGVRQELRVSLVLTFIMALRTFDLPLMATQGGPGYKTTTPSLIMYRDVFLNMQIGRGATIAVLLTLVIGLGVVLINRALSTKE